MKGIELTKWMERTEYTRAETAEALGVTRMAISYWENDLRPIPKMLPLALEALEARGKRKRKRKGR